MVCRVHKYADGGKVVKDHLKGKEGADKVIATKKLPPRPPMPKPKSGKLMADGGPVRSYGSPMSTPAPGGTTRKRPKPGDKDPNYKPRTPSPKPPAGKRPMKRVDRTPLYRKDSEGRPVGSAGEARNKRIMREVDTAQTGKK